MPDPAAEEAEREDGCERTEGKATGVTPDRAVGTAKTCVLALCVGVPRACMPRDPCEPVRMTERNRQLKSRAEIRFFAFFVMIPYSFNHVFFVAPW